MGLRHRTLLGLVHLPEVLREAPKHRLDERQLSFRSGAIPGRACAGRRKRNQENRHASHSDDRAQPPLSSSSDDMRWRSLIGFGAAVSPRKTRTVEQRRRSHGT